MITLILILQLLLILLVQLRVGGWRILLMERLLVLELIVKLGLAMLKLWLVLIRVLLLNAILFTKFS